MSVTATKKSGSSPETAIPPAAEETVLLELRKIKRYHHAKRLFEAGQVYRVSVEDAKELLQQTFQGRPVFVRYKPKPKPEVLQMQHGPVVNDVQLVHSNKGVVAGADGKPTGLELDDDPDFLKGLLNSSADEEAGGEHDETVEV